MNNFLASRSGRLVTGLAAWVVVCALASRFVGAHLIGPIMVGGALVLFLVLSRDIKPDTRVYPVQHCLTCGQEFKPASLALRGNTTLEIALWVLLLWPFALIYSIWRRLDAGKAKITCPVCAGNQVVPADTPAAAAHRKAIFP